jgi:hypothetical protein
MPFTIEVTSRNDTSGIGDHSVIVTIDGHETVLTFASKDNADDFAQVERARLIEDEKKASQRVREIAYRLWQEEGCPEGEDLRHWFAASILFERDRNPR